jgi:hypothetical protein
VAWHDGAAQAAGQARCEMSKTSIDVIVGNAALCREMQRAEALSELDREEAAYVPPAQLAAGDHVIQALPLHGPRGSWTVVECACDLCALGRHVAVDQVFEGGWRHIARVALRRRGEVSPRAAEAWVNGIAFTGAVERGLRRAEAVSPQVAELAHAFISELVALDVMGRP